MKESVPPAKAKVPDSKVALIVCVVITSVVLSNFILFGRSMATKSSAILDREEAGIEGMERSFEAPQFALVSLVVPALLFCCAVWAIFLPPSQLGWLNRAMGIAVSLSAIIFVVTIAWGLLPGLVIIRGMPAP